MAANGDDVVAAHTALASRVDLIEQRRLLYSMVHELVSPSGSQPLDDPDVLDSPVARALLGARMAGSRAFVPDEDLAGLSSLSEDWTVQAVGTSIAVAVTPSAVRALHAALARVAEEMSGAGGSGIWPSILTARDGDRLRASIGLVARGAALAYSAEPALVQDLLPHVALLAIVEKGSRLGSASVREFPGLVLVPEPASALEAAEALVHEAAHQKIFDFAVTYDFFPAHAAACPPCVPSWRPGDARWPLEQTLAAWHAYHCLAALAGGLGHDGLDNAGSGSLLTVAERRAEILGNWLYGHRRYLGADARLLLAGLGGWAPDGVAEPVVPIRIPVGPVIGRRRHGTRQLVGIGGRSPRIYWTS